MQLLPGLTMAGALQVFVEKKDNDSIGEFIDARLEQMRSKLLEQNLETKEDIQHFIEQETLHDNEIASAEAGAAIRGVVAAAKPVVKKKGRAPKAVSESEEEPPKKRRGTAADMQISEDGESEEVMPKKGRAKRAPALKKKPIEDVDEQVLAKKPRALRMKVVKEENDVEEVVVPQKNLRVASKRKDVQEDSDGIDAINVPGTLERSQFLEQEAIEISDAEEKYYEKPNSKVPHKLKQQEDVIESQEITSVARTLPNFSLKRKAPEKKTDVKPKKSKLSLS